MEAKDIFKWETWKIGNETKILASARKQVELARESKIQLANLLIVLIAFIVTIVFIVTAYIWIAVNWEAHGTNEVITGGGLLGKDDPLNTPNWLILSAIPFCGIAGYAGIVSVVAQNNKSPIKYFIFTVIVALYRLLFVVMQLITRKLSGDETIGVNSSIIPGQIALILMLVPQTYLWIKWNKKAQESGEGAKFQSEALSGKRAVLAWMIIGVVTTVLILFSTLFNGSSLVGLLMDVLPSAAFMIGAILNAFGNILCFPFYFVSNLGWVFWGLYSMIQVDSFFMFVFGITTILQSIGLNALLVTGMIQWLVEDFEYMGGIKFRKKERSSNTEETQITAQAA